MATIANLIVKIAGDSSQLNKELAATKRSIKKSLGTEGMAASQNALTAVTALAAGFGILSVASIKMAADMQVTQRAFTTIMGNADLAKEHLQDLTDFAANTPFGLEQLAASSKKLQAFGFAAQDVIPMLTSVGDAAAMLGSGTEGINGITMALAQMQAKGRVQGEELLQLAERGVNAYQYLGDAMGVSMAEAQKRVTAGAVSSTEGINAILLGMQKDFKGGMQGLADEIPGIVNTITDDSMSIMRTFGNDLIEATGLTDYLKELRSALGDFSTYAQNNGIGDALRDMVPVELKVTILALAGAIGGAAVGAIVAFGASIWAALTPLIPFLAAGAAIALVAGAIWQAWDPLSTYFSGLFDWLAGEADSVFTSLVQSLSSFSLSIMNVLEKILPEDQATRIRANMASITEDVKKMQTEIEEADTRSANGLATLQLAAGKIGKSFSDSGASVVASAKKIANTFTGLSTTVKKTTDSATTSMKKMESAAKSVSSSIEDQWIRITKTAMEQLEIWNAEELAKLNESAVANENYERDRERLAAVYSAKRIKIVEDEVEKMNEIRKSVDDTSSSYNISVSTSQSGSDGEIAQMIIANKNAVDEIRTNWDSLSETYKTLNESQKEQFIAYLDQKKIAYEQNGEDEITFEQAKEAQILAEKKKSLDDFTEYYQQNKDIKADIDEAYNENSLAMLQEALTEENAIRLNDYDAQQSMMETYQEAYLDAHATTAQLIADMQTTALDGLSTAFTDILTGAENAKEAFKALGKSMLSTIAQYYAKKLAGKIMLATFGKTALAEEVAAQTAAGAAVAAAWAKAAAMVSLATSGSNSVPAMAGITATTTLAVGLASVPALANGGVASSATLALIGEGNSSEAVVPLEKDLFAKLLPDNYGNNSTIVNAVYNNYSETIADDDTSSMNTFEEFNSMIQSGLRGV